MFKFPRTWEDFVFPRLAAAQPPGLVEPGLYHYQEQRDGEFVRFHLRVDDEGPAILIAAASEAVLLSPAGAAAAKGLLEHEPPEAIARRLKVAGGAQVVEDVRHALADLGQTSARYPIFNLVDPATYERPWRLSAPFQADLMFVDGAHARALLKRLWSVLIPHVRLLTMPATDRSALIQAVTFAEDTGMIAGVRAATAGWIRESQLVELAEAGLDYLVFPWGVTASHHDAVFGTGDFELVAGRIRDTLRWEMTPVAEIALTPEVTESLPAALDQLTDAGVRHAEVMAIADLAPSNAGRASSPSILRRGFAAPELRQLAGWIEDLADERRMQLIWLPPAARVAARPASRLAQQGPRAGGDVTIRVETDGSVIPPRGPYRVAGNLRTDPWEEIWQHEAFRRYRECVAASTRCDECPGLTICAADCPSNQRSWALPGLTEVGKVAKS